MSLLAAKRDMTAKRMVDILFVREPKQKWSENERAKPVASYPHELSGCSTDLVPIARSPKTPNHTHNFCYKICISARSWNIGTAHDINCRFQGDLDPVDSGWFKRTRAYSMAVTKAADGWWWPW